MYKSLNTSVGFFFKVGEKQLPTLKRRKEGVLKPKIACIKQVPWAYL